MQLQPLMAPLCKTIPPSVFLPSALHAYYHFFVLARPSCKSHLPQHALETLPCLPGYQHACAGHSIHFTWAELRYFCNFPLGQHLSLLLKTGIA